jgi:NAD(P)H-flavin reductase
MSIADNLAKLGQKPSAWRVRTVTDVTSPTVTVNVGDGQSIEVPCLSSYRSRAIGDKVLMVATDVGWCVLGRLGAEDP